MSRKLNIEEKKNKDLQSQYLKVVSDHKIEVNKLKEELESKSSQLSNLESDTEASDLEKTELHHKIFLQSSELEDIKCKLLKIQTEKTQMEAERDEFDDENVRLKRQINDKTADETASLLITEFKEKIEELTSSKNGTQKALDDACSRENSLKFQVDTLKNTLRRTKTEKEKMMTTAYRNIDMLKMEKFKLEKQLLSRDSEITSLKCQVKELEASRMEAKDALGQISLREKHLQKQIQDYQKLDERIKMENQTIKEQRTALEGNCAKLESKLANLESSRDNLDERVQILEREKADLNTKTQHLNGIINQKNKLFHAEVSDQVKKQLELEREMNEKLNTKLVESNEEKRKCEENFLEMKNKQLTVLEELQVAKKKCEDSEKNLESKEEILKDTANQVSSLSSKLNILENKNRVMQEDLKTKMKMLETLRHEVKSHAQSSRVMSEEVKQKDRQLKHYEDQILPLLRRVGLG